MRLSMNGFLTGMLLVGGSGGTGSAMAQTSATLAEGQTRATMVVKHTGELQTYELTTNAELRDHRPSEKRITFTESADHARVRTGSALFDGLYAMTVHEALQNSVSEIKDGAYGNGAPVEIEAFQTGEFWTYVWTRDLAYSVNLALAGFDPERCVDSLLFKASILKPSVPGEFRNQIIQDTGSGGSYPVSSDRVVWALGASETMKYLQGAKRDRFLEEIYPILRDTIETDRKLVFDPESGLYRGEQSFLDWREQSYPGWTKENVLPIAMSKALSVNAADYLLLKTTADYAERLGRKSDAARYAHWAENLKTAINGQFFDAEAGLYSTYLLSDGVSNIRVHRYDLLGESLAILSGVADRQQAETILANYPVGPHGPPVVWPQERTVPIYHNQAIWPFVTAYWIKAARHAGNWQAVDLGIRSLARLAAFNLSNMENYDFVTGLAEVKGRRLNGPVINSRRQLWSVAGYLSMVQDVVFGLEASSDGIRFRPFVTTRLRQETFPSSDVLALRNFAYCGTRHHVSVHLPSTTSHANGVFAIQRVELNGKAIGRGFVPADSLTSTNRWDMYLRDPESSGAGAPLNLVDVSNERALFGPVQPAWDEDQQDAITVEDGRLVLHYRHPDAGHVHFNIYRDGRICASGIHELRWTDPASTNHQDAVYSYAVEAIDPESGNASHLTPIRCCRTDSQKRFLPASAMENRGGNLVDKDHFEDWGQPKDELLTRGFRVNRSGRYCIRVKFSNGSGPVNTGITCAVKKLELRKASSDEVVMSGYVVMPQSGDWQRWDLSSPVCPSLSAGEDYSVRLCEDETCRNMSCLQKNERYTAWPGGGETSYNRVNVAAFQLDWIGNGALLTHSN